MNAMNMWGRRAALTGLFLLAIAGPGPWGPAGAAAQPADTTSVPADDVATARSRYDEGRFTEAATILLEGMATGRIIGGDIVRARELLARCQVKLGDAPGARRTFLSLLEQDPLYRPDPLRVPPDELAAYEAARRDFDREREREAQRIPASIAIHAGIGSGDNDDFGEYVASGGGESSYDNKAQFGGSVRFPLAPRISLDIEIQRFRATNEDSVSGDSKSTFEITAIPVSVSVHYLLLDGPRFRASAFAGGGPMLETSSSVDLPFFSFRLKVAEDNVGTYLHGGFEGEYRMHPRFSVTGRAAGRYAKATGYFEGSTFSQYDPNIVLGDREVDFSGFAATLGVRAYVGY